MRCPNVELTLVPIFSAAGVGDGKQNEGWGGGGWGGRALEDDEQRHGIKISACQELGSLHYLMFVLQLKATPPSRPS